MFVGEARLSGGEVHDVVELPAPGRDPLPHLAVGPGGVVLVEGTGPDQLAVHRLVDAGWTEPIRYDLPDGPTGSTTERVTPYRPTRRPSPFRSTTVACFRPLSHGFAGSVGPGPGR